MKRLLFWTCLVSILSGCAFFSHDDDGTKEGPVAVVEPLLEVEFVKSGRINDPQRLKAGGRLLIKPFSPGPNVEVSEELDVLSLRIIRGVLDVYEQKWPTDATKEKFDVSNFDVAVAAEEEDVSELKLHGRITEITRSSHWKKWVLLKPKLRLSVQGWLVDAENKATVLSFTDTLEMRADVINHRDMALEIGRHIGQFIFKKR